MIICANGHETSEDLRFCDQCGILTVPDTALCAYGHINPHRHKFCGECGAPITAPTAAGPGEPTGRWTVDPSYRHHFRYLHDGTWTEHVADIGDGALGTDPAGTKQRARGRAPADILVGVVLLVLIVGAVSAAALFFSRSTQAAATNVQGQQSAAHPTAVPPAEFLPTPTTFRPLAVIGAPCSPSTVNGVQKNGAIAYCELLEESNTHMWSMYWGVIESPYAPDEDPNARENPNIAVCMKQTGLSREACVAELPS